MTREHEVTLAKEQCRLDIRKFLFLQRTVNEWSRLSADCEGVIICLTIKLTYISEGWGTQINWLDCQ